MTTKNMLLNALLWPKEKKLKKIFFLFYFLTPLKEWKNIRVKHYDTILLCLNIFEQMDTWKIV